MPAQLPHRPPLAFRLWLAQRFGLAKPTDVAASGHKVMNVESLEHIVRSRLRMFLRHTWLVAILAMLILGAGIWGAIYVSTAPTEMTIAAGPAGSANVKLVQLMAQKFAAEHDNVRLHLAVTDGPNESAAAITSGRADLAVVPGTIGNSPNLPVVAILQQNVMALIVPTPPPPPAAAPKKEPPPAKAEAIAPEKKEKPAKAAKGGKKAKTAGNDDSAKSDTKNDTKSEKSDKAAKAAKTAGKNADKADDADADDSSGDADAADANKLDKVGKLAGKRIGIVTGSVATRDLLDLVLNHYGVPLGQAQVSLIDPKKVADAVKAQQVDVLFAAGSATGQAINDAVTAATVDGRAPSFIPIDQAEGIANRHPAFASADIDAGTFGGNPPAPDDDLKSLSFPEYLVARKSFSHDGVAALARLIYTSRLALAAAMPGEIRIAAPSTDKDASVIVHPGALAYLTDDQKTFFDKYGDDIFYGLLIFPIFGSAIAGVASYFRNSGRTRRLRLLQSLLDLVRKANTAPSLEALDAIQAEVDHQVTGIIHLSEREDYDQSMQMSFSLALDQARFAIASRRTVLLEGGAIETKPGAKAAAA